MIKLNNKNITYVALADSNNSLKAPKEIWYADSSNSVRLVYRRKDALIEGEDYEKYHWLDGRNGAYINTEHLVKTYEDVFEVYAKYDGTLRNPDGEEQDLFGIQNDNIVLVAYITGGNNINAVIKQNESTGNHNILFHKDVFRLTLYAPNSSQYIKTLDGVSYTNPIDGTVTNDTNLKMYVFTRNGMTGRYFHGDISYFRITDTSSNTKMSLIPCKLLKPVPKWLDANGIRRQVGECGMIDLVSGKFYGNVNSVGTFTVENYYEKKEWLQGRNGAYINTNHKLKAFEDSFEVHARYDGTIKNPNGQEQNIFGYTHLTNNEITEICRAYINTSGRISCNYYAPDGSWNPLPNSLGITDIHLLSYVVSTEHIVVLNGVTYTLSTNGMQSKEYGSFIALFSNNGDDDGGTRVRNRYFHGDIAYFKITDTSSNTKMNLIPCTLTMDLPASMDANNIARTKGTSGMWDLVSDKFYGNVANSGTFKAVNLAEGVDYEVHQWLKGRNGAYIDTAYYPVFGTDVFNCHFRYDGTMRNPDGVEQDAFGVNANGCRISAYINGDNYLSCNYFKPANNYFPSTGKYSKDWIVSELMTVGSNFQYTANGIVYNFTNQSMPSFTSPASLLLFNCRQGANPPNYLHGDIAYFKITDTSSNTKMSLIPVKLLRSIPSKYDANGIARQAGECGMYDTVNDVFYGNVASSGSFTVSDN